MSESSLPLDPDGRQRRELGEMMLEAVLARAGDLPSRPSAWLGETEFPSLLQPPPEQGRDPRQVLAQLNDAADKAMETSGPGDMAFIPGSGLYTAALAELFTRATNRYGGITRVAPALSTMEESVIQWIATDVCGFPADGQAGGLLTTGGSLATFSAVVAARKTKLGEDFQSGTVYTTEFAHHSVLKACRLAGIREDHIRLVPHTEQLRMDPAALQEMVRADRLDGKDPFLVVATAGSTDTGTIDPLSQVAEVAEKEGLWFHVDAAYGGFFTLTEAGRRRLEGLDRADSVTLDPHKGLFQSFGTGALAVRDRRALLESHAGTGPYLQDLQDLQGTDVLDSSMMGPELTHEIRGIRLWFPLHVHGVAAFREELEEKLQLAKMVHARLIANPGLVVPYEPDLSVVVFRLRPRGEGEEARERAALATEELLRRINARGRAVLSSTRINGDFTVRVAVLSHRTHRDRVEEILEQIEQETRQLDW